MGGLWMEGWMHGCMYPCIDAGAVVDEWMNRWMDRRMAGWMEKPVRYWINTRGLCTKTFHEYIPDCYGFFIFTLPQPSWEEVYYLPGYQCWHQHWFPCWHQCQHQRPHLCYKFCIKVFVQVYSSSPIALVSPNLMRIFLDMLSHILASLEQDDNDMHE